jgi:hypothetical protein
MHTNTQLAVLDTKGQTFVTVIGITDNGLLLAGMCKRTKLGFKIYSGYKLMTEEYSMSYTLMAIV